MQDGMRVAMLISGGGTTMQQVLLACASGRLRGVVPALVIASTPEAGGILKAKAAGMPEEDVIVVQRRDYQTSEAFGDSILRECRERGVQHIAQLGWMPKTPMNVVQAFEGHMTNQHPGPLDPGYPDFGGQGMYGRRVHHACLYFMRAHRPSNPWTEVVAQRVAVEFDRGCVLHRAIVPILSDDDVVSLQARALAAEHIVQIEALGMFARGRVAELHFGTRLIAPGEETHLENAKRAAWAAYPKG